VVRVTRTRPAGHRRLAIAASGAGAVTKVQADALVTIDPALATNAAHIVPVAPVAALSVD
jgi:hypothetical protein